MVEASKELAYFSLYTPIARSSQWLFRRAAAPSNWNQYDFDDTSWNQVTLGSVLLSYSGAQYFRKKFTGSTILSAYEAQFRYRYGIVVHINGHEVYRDNLPEGSVTATTTATGEYSTYSYHSILRPASEIASTTNILAVELHFFSIALTSPVLFNAFLSVYAHSRPRSNCFVYAGLLDPSVPYFDFDLQSGEAISQVPASFGYSLSSTMYVNGVAVWYPSDTTSSITSFSVYRIEDEDAELLLDVDTPFYVPGRLNTFTTSESVAASQAFRLKIDGVSSLPATLLEVQLMTCSLGLLSSIAFPQSSYVYDVSLEEVDIHPSVLYITDCSLSGSLPAGLLFDSPTCTISGIPTENLPETPFTMSTTWNGGTIQGSFTLRLTNFNNHRYLLVRKQSMQYANRESFSILSNGVVVVNSPALSNGMLQEFVYTIPRSSDDLYELVLYHTTSQWYVGSWIELVNGDNTIVFKGFMATSREDHYFFSLYTPISDSSLWSHSTSVTSMGWYLPDYDFTSWESITLSQSSVTGIPRYYRTSFTGMASMAAYHLNLKYRYGIIVYVAGKEVYRDQLGDSVVPSTVTTSLPGYSSYEVHRVVRSGSEVSSSAVSLAFALYFPSLTSSYSLDAMVTLHLLHPSVSGTYCYLYPYGTSSATSTNDYNTNTGVTFSSFPYAITYTFDGSLEINGLNFIFSSMDEAPSEYRVEGYRGNSWVTLFSKEYRHVKMNDVISFVASNTYQQVKVSVLAPSLESTVTISEFHPLVCTGNANTISYPDTNQILFVDQKVRIEPTLLGYLNCMITPSLPAGLTLASDCTIEGSPTAASGYTTYYVTSGSYQGSLVLTVRSCSGTIVKFTRTYQQAASNEGFVVINSVTSDVILSVPLHSEIVDYVEWSSTFCLTSASYTVTLLSATDAWQAGSFLYITANLPNGEEDELLRLRVDSSLNLPSSYMFSTEYIVPVRSYWFYRMGTLPSLWYNSDVNGWGLNTAGNFPSSSNQLQLYKTSAMIASVDFIAGFTILIRHQYGYVLMINGVEAFRFGVRGQLTSSSAATETTQLFYHAVSLPIRFLKQGSNLFAIAIVTPSSTIRTSVFDCTIRLDAGNINRVSSYKLTAVGSNLEGNPSRIFEDTSSFWIGNTQCVSSMLDITFANDRREWVSSIVLRRVLGYPSLKQIVISGLSDGSWNQIYSTSSLQWNSDGTTKISLPQTNPIAFNSLRLSDFSTLSTSACSWRLQQIQILSEATQVLPTLEYPEADLIVLYVPIQPIRPITTGFNFFSISPSLPIGLSLNETTGEIKGTPIVASDMTSYIITGKLNAQDAMGSTTIISFSVMVCEEPRTLVTLHIRSNEPKFIIYKGDTVISSSEKYDVMGSVSHSPSTPPSTTLPSNVENQLYFCLEHAQYALHLFSSSESGWDDNSYFYLSLDNNQFIFESGFLSAATMVVPFSSFTPFQAMTTTWRLYKSALSISSWMQRDFDDGYWTISKPGDIGSSNSITIYLRKTFALPDLSSYALLNVRISYIGGVVAYLNGRQWARFNLASPFTSTTRGSVIHSSSTPSFFHVILPQARVREDKNVMAFEVHRANGESTTAPFTFDATGLVLVADCSIAMDSYVSVSGTTPSEGVSSFFFDYDPSTYAIIDNGSGSTVNWEVENLEGTTFTSFAILERSARYSLGFSVRARQASTEGFTTLLNPGNQNLPERTRSQWTMITKISTYRQFRLTLTNILNGGIDAANIYLQYCKGDMTEMAWYYKVTEGEVPSDWMTSESLDWPITTGSFPTASSVTQYYQGVTSLLYLPFYHHILITMSVKAGAILYLNGNELLRVNLPSTGVTASTEATSEHEYATTYIISELIEIGNVRLGENFFAAEMHRYLQNENSNSFSLSVEYVEDDQRISDAAVGSTEPSQDGANGSMYLFDSNVNTVTIIPNHCVGLAIFWDFATRYEVVNKIAITNGPDHNERTPRGWKFYGRRTGDDWVLLQLHENVTFSGVKQTQEFEVTNVDAYNSYRMIISQCASETFQLADIELYSHAQTGSCEESDDFKPTANGDNAWQEGDGCDVNYDGGFARKCTNGEWSDVFLLCVLRAPVSIQYAAEAFEVRTNRPITPIAPEIVAKEFTLAIEPALPDGLEFNASNGTISGIPNVLSSATSYTITVTNIMGSLSTVISITVVQGPIDCPAADGIPAILDGETAPFACPAYFRGWTILRCVTGVVGVFENHCAITDASFGLGVSSLRLRMGEAIPALSVVSSLPPMTFSISPALPDGLSFIDGQLSGSLTALFTSQSFQITGSLAVATLRDVLVDLQTPPPLLQVLPSQPLTFTASLTLSSLPCPQDALFPETPSGETASITSDCPLYHAGQTTRFCRSGVWDEPQRVCSVLPVTDFHYSPSSLTVQVGQSVHYAVHFTGIVASFASDPALPAGLSIAESGDIAGVVSALQAAQLYTIRAISSESASQSTVISLTVVEAGCLRDDVQLAHGETFAQSCDATHATSYEVKCVNGEFEVVNSTPCAMAPPSGLAYEAAAFSILVGSAFSTNFPAVTGSNVTFAVAPALPSGLSIDEATGRVFGEGKVSAARKAYTVTASNPEGATTTVIELSVGFPVCEAMEDAEESDVGVSVVIPCNASFIGEQMITCQVNERAEVGWSEVQGSCTELVGQFYMVLLAILVLAVSSLLFLLCAICCCKRKRRTRGGRKKDLIPTPTPTPTPIQVEEVPTPPPVPGTSTPSIPAPPPVPGPSTPIIPTPAPSPVVPPSPSPPPRMPDPTEPIPEMYCPEVVDLSTL